MQSCAIKTTQIPPVHVDNAVYEQLWPVYTTEASSFCLWSPLADNVQLRLYKDGDGGTANATYPLQKDAHGVWRKTLKGDFKGVFYTYQVTLKDKRLEETPGIYAQAVGVNGRRAMMVDLEATNPPGWQQDKSPQTAFPNDAVIYEMHVRDFSIDASSGIAHKGKYLGIAEAGTKGPGNLKTGLDHLTELGITHVHLLPVADFPYLDEFKPDVPQYNWGYGPANYNVPEGFYATDALKGEVRIREFKEMVKALHNRGIGVVLDVVYNHTADVDHSNFSREVPDYYYRFTRDGQLSNASGCGNETASEKAMMRKFMLESVSYWLKEYHIDGFRFDLMAVHDIETMNAIADAVKAINPCALLYGEGWTAGSSPYPPQQLAYKVNMGQLPAFAAFSDEIRDGLKGSWQELESPGFVSGEQGMEESVKMGIVGCIDHPQIRYDQVNTAKEPWALEPWQAVLYVSCHDNNTLYDKLKLSRPDASEHELIAMDKLANAVVLTSQGIPFIHAGAEMLRTKKGVENSYESPDSINAINWNWKKEQLDLLNYYEGLIRLRKQHPAFRMKTAEEVREKLTFSSIETGLISYQLTDHANGDSWKSIFVIFNAKSTAVLFNLPGSWKIAVRGDHFGGNEKIEGRVEVPPVSMLIGYQE